MSATSNLLTRSTQGGEEGRDSRRVISALEPIPAEAASSLQFLREGRASIRRDAAVGLAPEVGSGVPFPRAGVEEAEAAAGHLGLVLVSVLFGAR